MYYIVTALDSVLLLDLVKTESSQIHNIFDKGSFYKINY